MSNQVDETNDTKNNNKNNGNKKSSKRNKKNSEKRSQNIDSNQIASADMKEDEATSMRNEILLNSTYLLKPENIWGFRPLLKSPNI